MSLKLITLFINRSCCLLTSSSFSLPSVCLSISFFLPYFPFLIHHSIFYSLSFPLLIFYAALSFPIIPPHRSTFESMAAERERDTNPPTESRSSSTNSHFAFSSEEGEEDDEEDDDDDDEEEEDFRTASETSSSSQFHQQTSEDHCDWGELEEAGL